MVNFKKLLVSRQKKNNEQRKKKVFRLDLRDLIHFQVPQAEMDPIWWDFYLMNQLGMKIWRSEHEIKKLKS